MGDLGLPFSVPGFNQGNQGGEWESGPGREGSLGKLSSRPLRGSCVIPSNTASHAGDLGSFKSCDARRTNRGNTLHLAFGLKV